MWVFGDRWRRMVGSLLVLIAAVVLRSSIVMSVRGSTGCRDHDKFE
jgi:hypothetical protein